MERSIIHLNIADFAVEVERVIDRRLKSWPVIIAPEGSRALVYDMSDEAYNDGVRKGMSVSRATRLVRKAAILPPRPEIYERATTAFVKRALPYSPLVEAAEGDGHLFVDATGTEKLFGHPQDVAERIRKSTLSEIRLNPIWAVASNKLVAKVATRMVKPFGEYTVEAGREESFVRPLPVTIIPGIYENEITRLRELNLIRAGEVAKLTVPQLAVVLDKRAQLIRQKAIGFDDAPVLPAGKKELQVVHSHVFGNDTNDIRVIESALFTLTERIGEELRKRCLDTRRLNIIVDYCDGIRKSKSVATKKGLSANVELFGLFAKTLTRAWTRRVRVRHIRLVCDRLIPAVRQLDLFTEETKKQRRNYALDKAVDSIRSRFGENTIRLGKSILAAC